ncbi:MAG: response regulator [Cyanobacteria bacterium HKST-UBA02]|nr:response regulator [Cyanobacteria bacterium HKST-UBA02]
MADQPATKSVKKAIDESKERFLKVAMERINKARKILEEIENGTSDQLKIENLCRFYHQLAGAGGLYEMNEFCACAIAAEDLSMQLPELKEKAFTSTVNQLVQLTDKLTRLVTEAGEEPADNAQAQYEAELAKQSKSGNFKAQILNTVLVVSTNPNTTRNLSGILDKLGINMEHCSTYEEARNYIDEQLPDGLIVCTPISGGSPLNLSTAIRKKEGGDDIPIVFVSDVDNFLDKVKAIQSGCDAFWDINASVQQIEDKARRTFAKLSHKKYKILLVEDDPVQATAMYNFLVSAGFDAFVMTNAEEFEEGLLSSQPDLIILDVMLGEITGFELARYVRQNEKFSTTPIIFLTTQNALNFHIQGAKLGDDYLIKPAAPQLLVATIAGRLERYKTIADLMGRDALTGTLSYAEFMKEAERVSGRQDIEPSILVIDINGLAKINEKHGYASGEKVIAALAEQLKRTIRNFGIIGRLAGDEFGILADSMSDTELLELASYLKNEFSKLQFTSDEGEFSVTITCGISRLKEGVTSVNEWLNSAYEAARIAKQHGSDSVGID